MGSITGLAAIKRKQEDRKWEELHGGCQSGGEGMDLIRMMDKRKRRKTNPINLGFVCEKQLRTYVKASLTSSEAHLSTCTASQPKGQEALLSLIQT